MDKCDMDKTCGDYSRATLVKMAKIALLRGEINCTGIDAKKKAELCQLLGIPVSGTGHKKKYAPRAEKKKTRKRSPEKRVSPKPLKKKRNTSPSPKPLRDMSFEEFNLKTWAAMQRKLTDDEFGGETDLKARVNMINERPEGRLMNKEERARMLQILEEKRLPWKEAQELFERGEYDFPRQLLFDMYVWLKAFEENRILGILAGKQAKKAIDGYWYDDRFDLWRWAVGEGDKPRNWNQRVYGY